MYPRLALGFEICSQIICSAISATAAIIIMPIVSSVIVSFVAVEHVGILYLEMFAWEKKGPKVFRNFPKDLFPKTTVLAANQGLYNGFLAAGLVWSLVIVDPMWSRNIGLYFLSCVSVAGVYGALTASKKIFYVQAMPALVGIMALVTGI